MRKKLLVTVMASCSLLLIQSGKLYAQLQPSNFDAPTVPQKPHAPTVQQGLATLSTAMIECPTVGMTIAAIVHSDNGKAYLYVELGDGISAAGPMEVTDRSAGAVDVALADDPVYPGFIYRALVTYRDAGPFPNTYHLWAKQYEIKLEPNVPAISVQFQQRLDLGLVPFGRNNLRTDAVPTSTSATVGGGSIPLIDRFMILYSDASDNMKIRMVPSNDITFPLIDCTPYPGYVGKDIAACIDVNNANMPVANVAVQPVGSAPSNLACLEVNMNTGTGTLNHLFPGNPYDPRIEAFGLYDPSRGIKWTIVARENMQKIMLYTGPGTGYHCNPSQYNPASGMTQEYPTIAAGIGPAWGGNIGNEQYSYAWGDPSKGRYLAQALNFWGDPINPDNASIVNNTYCTPMPSDPSDIISMSNSCNTGLGTVVAWNEGNKIFYKFLGNTYQFRPTGIEQVKSLPDFEIYPNPAADNFQLSLGNSSDKFAISIASLDGKVVLTQDGSGKVAKVDVSKLVPGVYFVEVSNEASRSVQRLVKK